MSKARLASRKARFCYSTPFHNPLPGWPLEASARTRRVARSCLTLAHAARQLRSRIGASNACRSIQRKAQCGTAPSEFSPAMWAAFHALQRSTPGCRPRRRARPPIPRSLPTSPPPSPTLSRISSILASTSSTMASTASRAGTTMRQAASPASLRSRRPSDIPARPATSWPSRRSTTRTAPCMRRALCSSPCRASGASSRAPARSATQGTPRWPRDIANLKAAIGSRPVADVFMTALSPSNVALYYPNQHYATDRGLLRCARRGDA